MILVTVELISAKTGKHKPLGTATISNDGTGTPELADYDVVLSKWGRPKSIWRRGRVLGFKRKRLGPWHLLQRALNAALGDST